VPRMSAVRPRLSSVVAGHDRPSRLPLTQPLAWENSGAKLRDAGRVADQRFATAIPALLRRQSLADADNASNPPTALPLIIDSTVFDANNFASGASIAASGLLSTSADVMTTAGFASAVGSAEFIGMFTAMQPYVLLQFPAFNSSDFTNGATAFSGGSLFVRLTSGTSTLFDQVFTVGGPPRQGLRYR